jgi:hypothetical protein
MVNRLNLDIDDRQLVIFSLFRHLRCGEGLAVSYHVSERASTLKKLPLTGTRWMRFSVQ